MTRQKPIVFYNSALCPRCMLARRALRRLRLQFPDMKIEEVDVVANPLRAWRDGIRMIPALRAGDDLLAGIFLREEAIRRFVARQMDRCVASGQE